jgi:hypothetical protein
LTGGDTLVVLPADHAAKAAEIAFNPIGVLAVAVL